MTPATGSPHGSVEKKKKGGEEGGEEKNKKKKLGEAHVTRQERAVDFGTGRRTMARCVHCRGREKGDEPYAPGNVSHCRIRKASGPAALQISTDNTGPRFPSVKNNTVPGPSASSFLRDYRCIFFPLLVFPFFSFFRERRGRADDAEEAGSRARSSSERSQKGARTCELSRKR